MSKLSRNLIQTASAMVGASFLLAPGAIAEPIDTTASMVDLNNESSINFELDSDPMDQVTSVSELRDVQPTEWAYEALRSLVERYGCIVGYPDRTYRGDRALSRWEFAAGLNACMNVMERLIQENVSILKEDVDKLKRLMQEFEAELAALGARVDNLEGRVSFLEEHQFSTTTKLNGEVIFAVIDTFGDSVGSNEDETQTTFSDRVRLNLDTSFTGKDRLRTRLEAGNVANLRNSAGTPMARVGFDANTGNSVEVSDLYYRFPIGEKITAWVGTAGLDIDDVFDVTNPYLESSGTGALSRFARRNPVVYRGPEGAGVGLKYKFSDAFNLTALYLADGDDAPDPSEGSGLFNGNYSTGVQLGFSPTDRLDLSLTYVHSFEDDGANLSSDTGSTLSRNVFDGSGVTAERFGLQASWRVAEKVNLAAWGGYLTATAHGGASDGDNADLWTWNANVSFLDLGKEGANLSISGGMPPRLTNVDGGGEDDETSYLIEAQYQYPLTDNILITPGFYVILNPDHDDNDTLWVGVIRTTFKF